MNEIQLLNMLAAISGQGLVEALIWLVVMSLVLWVLWWGLGRIGLPEPFNKVATVILVLFTVLILVNFLLSLIGRPLVKW